MLFIFPIISKIADLDTRVVNESDAGARKSTANGGAAGAPFRRTAVVSAGDVERAR